MFLTLLGKANQTFQVYILARTDMVYLLASLECLLLCNKIIIINRGTYREKVTLIMEI